MSEYIYKKGLYERLNLDVDIPAPRFKNYEYTKKDFIDTSYKDKIPFLFVDSTVKKIKLENGVLSFNTTKYDISKLTIREVLNIFEKEEVVVNILEDSDILTLLPSVFLSDFNNTTVTKIDGDISPLNYKSKVLKNKTIYNIEENITSINIVDLSKNTQEPFSLSGDNIFYVVGRNTKCYVKTMSSSFYILGDMNVKQILDGAFIANLNNKLKNENDEIIEVNY